MSCFASPLRNRPRIIVGYCACLVFGSLAAVANAGTIVLANRTVETISFRLGDEVRKIASGEVLPIRTIASQMIRFPGSVRPYYKLDPNAIYFFGPDPPNRIDLIRIGLSGDATSSSIFESDLITSVLSPASRGPSPLVTIPVKLLVDDEEAAQRDSWERRLRNRLKEASAIFERHCFVRFEVAAIDSWDSDDEITEFELSLKDFEGKVKPEPARLAIGFTSQYRVKIERMHLGGTRGPMHSHLLVREWSNHISESERLEVLVHELGHFLGAVHSPEADSVMRAVLGDRQARAAGFRIGFDPVNTLAMCLVSDAMRDGRVSRFANIRLPTQLELHKLYRELSKTDLGDKTPGHYVSILEQGSLEPLIHGAKLVVMGINNAAENNAKLPERTEAGDEAVVRESGDGLTDFYIRTAADIAAQLPAAVGPRVFLLGLGIGLDRTAALREHRLIGPFCERIETEPQRTARLAMMGVPTAHDKHELARHFVLAAALTAIVDAESAERACLAVQLGSSTKPGDFSPAIYQADLAGIVFAHRVLSGKLSLASIANGFTANDHLPPFDPPEDLISPAEFAKRYGSVHDPRFRKLRAELGMPLRKLALPRHASRLLD